LTAKLAAAAASLRRPRGTHVALGQLRTFEQEVAAKSPVPIAEADAANLLEFAREIEELLRAGLGVDPIVTSPVRSLGEPVRLIDPRW
jgi:hypothetical protein